MEKTKTKQKKQLFCVCAWGLRGRPVRNSGLQGSVTSQDQIRAAAVRTVCLTLYRAVQINEAQKVRTFVFISLW